MTPDATRAGIQGRPRFALPAPSKALARRLSWVALAGQVLFVASWVIAGALEPGYSHLDAGVSVLSAGDAQHPWIVATGLVVMGLSLGALGPALLAVLRPRRARGVAAASLAVAGAGFVAVGVLPIDCSLDEAHCRVLSDAGELSWQHYAHLWTGLLIQLSLSIAPFAVVRALWPHRAALALLFGSVPAVLFGFVTWPLWNIEEAPHGLIDRVELALVPLFVLLLSGGVLHTTRHEPRLPPPAPLRPREFFGRVWRGEGVLMLQPWFLWRRFAPRFAASREITWLNDETFVVEDTADFSDGRVERRRRFCELAAPDRFRVTSVDLVEPTEIRIDDAGFRVAPYRMRVPYGPVGITLRCRDELRVEPDGTLVDDIRMRFLGLPVARVLVRARLTDPGDG